MATIESAELTDPQVGNKRLLFRLFHEYSVRVFNPFSLVDQCSCSREKIKGILETFPSDERNEMVKNKYISVTCEFCSTTYRFELQEFSEEKT